MKRFLKLIAITGILVYLGILGACGGGVTEPKTEPTPEPIAKEPTIEELRKPVAKDPGMFKVQVVIKKYGKKTKDYMAYEKYQKMNAGQPNGAFNADWFYDSYNLDFNEKGYYATVTYGTAKRAIERDPRIEKLMADMPAHSITVKLKTPSGRTYLLNDAEADGVLDFVKDIKSADNKIDIPLLDKMQEKYTWLTGHLKKYYKK